jgi:hypothetical protein
MFPIRITAAFSILLLFCGLTAYAEEGDRTVVSPLRLSYVEGDVSFWRDGAADWVNAQLNTPLAAGDALYVGDDGDVELQMGNRAFVRADDDTQLTLVNQTPDFIQFEITYGRVSFDLRTLPAGNSVELDTPNAVFTIEHAGYYRVDVDGDVHFITRRGGRATMVPAGGQAMSINPSEEIVVSGTAVAQAETYVAPEIDGWDRWNYDRTEGLLDAVSERYLPYGIAGASDLDHYGNWRVAPDYGPIWVPDTVPPGWAPYSTGSWGWDPYYQWTWIDDAPWGWAPFHYGRWIYLGGYWAWVPGPVIRHPVYAPALVAFFNVSPNVSLGINSAGMGWVALGWGEPVIPWWGRSNFIGRPWWGGWGGPRVVNNAVVRDTTVVDVNHIAYNNTHIHNAVVATTRDHFGHGRVHDAPVHVTQTRELAHVHGDLPVKPGPASLVAGAHSGPRPPESVLSRRVLATRPPHESKLPWRAETAKAATVQERRFVLVPKHIPNDLPRPAYGAQTGAERPRPPLPPRFMKRSREESPGNVVREHAEAARASPSIEPGISRTDPSVAPQRMMREIAPQRAVQQQEQGDLPGKPANRVFRDNRTYRDREEGDANENSRDERRGPRQRPDGF